MMICKDCGSTNFYGVLELPNEEETPYCVDCDLEYIIKENTNN